MLVQQMKKKLLCIFFITCLMSFFTQADAAKNIPVGVVPADVSIFAYERSAAEVWRYNVNSTEHIVQKDKIFSAPTGAGWGIETMSTVSNAQNDISILLTESGQFGRVVRLIELPQNNLAAKKITSGVIPLKAGEGFYEGRIYESRNAKYMVFLVFDNGFNRNSRGRILLVEYKGSNQWKIKEIAQDILFPRVIHSMDASLLLNSKGEAKTMQIVYTSAKKLKNVTVDALHKVDVDLSSSTWKISKYKEIDIAEVIFNVNLENETLFYGLQKLNPRFETALKYRYRNLPAVQVSDQGWGLSLSSYGAFSHLAYFTRRGVQHKFFAVNSEIEHRESSQISKGSVRETSINRTFVGAKINDPQSRNAYVAFSAYGPKNLTLELHAFGNKERADVIKLDEVLHNHTHYFDLINVESLF